ncbi:hypothetical protein CAS74_003449 [Pichia kudriavzevii]|uniref:Methionyl-tRNA formyltransferase n=1 Tax=Pichia kudriavzevii TaxID=4909 RepID=A0A1Z8JL74_PICKU|nr:hypothetical protein CAS74_003449 [Pichia kudriavzevii]
MKIAYFGTDFFSISTLKHIVNHPSISHLDIITRLPKPSGRGLKSIKESPLATFAKSNDLNLLYAESKQDFEKLKHQYDLAVAVSFGQLIPALFLDTLKYPGLNVHPSLLPKYSGDILLQETHPIQQNETLLSLSESLANKGGEMLSYCLSNGLFDPSSPNYKTLKPQYPYSYAAKIKPAEREISWSSPSDYVIRQFNTLGPLYTFKPALKKDGSTVHKRIVLDNIVKSNRILSVSDEILPNGTFILGDNDQLDIKCHDSFASVGTIKTEGIGSESPTKFVNSLSKKFGNTENIFISI